MYFRDVQHQPRALAILRRALASGRTHHAYLFDGPEGVGKEMTARALAARLLCHDAPSADAAAGEAGDDTPSLFGPPPDEPADPSDDGGTPEPCGACPSCRLFAAGTHPDYHLIHRGLHKLHPDRAIRDSKGLYLAVDLIRHFLIEASVTTSQLGHGRVFLIRDAERMNEGAQNALLKTLEEPPRSTRIIAVSSSAQRLLPTIRSRCQRIPFDRLPPDFVAAQLTEQAGLDAGPAGALARLSDGRLGAALRWHRIGLLDALAEVVDNMPALAGRDPERFAKGLLEVSTALAGRTMAVAEDELETAPDDGPPKRRRTRTAKAPPKSVPTGEARAALKLTLLLVAALCRDALALRHSDAAPCLLPDHAALTKRMASKWSADALDEGIRAVAEAERMIDQNVTPQLACERLAVALLGELSRA